MSMSTLAASFRRILKQNQPLRAGIQRVKCEVLGHLPQLNMRTGHQYGKKQLKGVYYNQYYMDPIEKFARKVSDFLKMIGNPEVWMRRPP
jgi:hypothetical protein